MISLLGPTAAGKSKLAVEIAKHLNGEIISADSMQVYRGMDIGTAKLPREERAGIPHHLIDIRDPDEDWTVSDFVEQTNQLISDIDKRDKLPIVVGGTGLYLWSLLEGYSFPIAPADKEIRSTLEKETCESLYERLVSIDLVAATKIHPNDKKRIIRALEVYMLTGKPISELQRKATDSPRLSVGNNKPLLIGISLPREELYKRIGRRVDEMIDRGLIEEVTGLLAKGYSSGLPSFQALGYKEVVEYLNGKWKKEEMISELKKRTRHFARRQMTWFKRFKEITWFEAHAEFNILMQHLFP